MEKGSAWPVAAERVLTHCSLAASRAGRRDSYCTEEAQLGPQAGHRKEAREAGQAHTAVRMQLDVLQRPPTRGAALCNGRDSRVLLDAIDRVATQGSVLLGTGRGEAPVGGVRWGSRQLNTTLRG